MTTSSIDEELFDYVEWLSGESVGCLSEDVVEKLLECSLRGEGEELVEVDGLRLVIPCSDTPEAWANLLHVYCWRDYERVEGFTPRQGWVIVDAGAYLGFYTLRSAKLVGQDGLVIAVEPLARNRRILETNVALNGFINQVRVDPRALGGGSYASNMWVSCYPATSSFYRYYVERHGDVCGETKVRVATLTELLRDHGLSRVDLLKLDVEGAELNVLSIEGWESVVERLVVEVHPWVVSVEDVVWLLERRGYAVRVVDIGSESQVMVYAWRGGEESGYAEEGDDNAP